MTQAPHVEPDSEEDLGSEMSLFDHLKELRLRLIYALGAVLIGAILSWNWRNDIFLFLLKPLQDAAPVADMAKVHYKDLTEPFFVMLKTSITAGIFFALPVILWQVWRFIAPGLYQHERRTAIPFVIMATLFFLFGASFCYYFVMPFGFAFLFKFSDPISTANLMIQEHYNFTLRMLLAFGAVFELPVLAMFLSAIGVITHHTLIKYWRHSVLGSFILAAILTPPDVATQIAMAVPMCLLYGVSIIVAWFFTTRRERRERAANAALNA